MIRKGTAMLLIPIVLIIAIVIGIIEWQAHQKYVAATPIRVNVNGIREKSTVTRLITGIIKEADIKRSEKRRVLRHGLFTGTHQKKSPSNVVLKVQISTSKKWLSRKQQNLVLRLWSVSVWPLIPITKLYFRKN